MPAAPGRAAQTRCSSPLAASSSALLVGGLANGVTSLEVVHAARFRSNFELAAVNHMLAAADNRGRGFEDEILS
jgi:hypothetical protein